MPQANITYDTGYNRKLKSLLDEMDAKHWNNGTSQYHPSMMGFKLSNFHGDYAGEPSARMMVGGGSHGDQHFIHSGNSPAYPPYMMSSGMLVNSGGARIGVDGAVGGYSLNDFGKDVGKTALDVGKQLLVAKLKGGRKKKGGANVGEQIASVAKNLAPFAPLLMGLGRPAPKSKADVVDALKDLGAKKSHSLKKLKEIVMQGGKYTFGDFGKDVGKTALDVGKQLLVAKLQGGKYTLGDFGKDVGKTALDVGKQLLVAKLQGGRKKKATKEGGINLKDVVDSAVPSIANLVKSADPAVKNQVASVAKSVASKVKSAVGAGGRNKRAEIVKKVMKDRGVSMIQASSIVKKEGLYKK